MGVKVRQQRGAWWLLIDFQKRRVAKRIGVGPMMKKAANDAAIQITAKLAAGDLSVFDAAPAITPAFAAVAEAWLTTYPKLRAIRVNTVENYTSVTRRHLVPYFGTMPITAITSTTIENFIAAKRTGVNLRGRTGLADATLKIAWSVLRLILRSAQRQRLIASNPWDLAEWRAAKRVEHVDPFTSAELRAILDAAEAIDRDFATLLRIWAQSGARAGEMLALRSEDVDHERGTILIRRTWSRGRVGPTKTGRERSVSFLHPVAEATSEWRPGVTPDSRIVLTKLRSLSVQPIDPTGVLFTRKGAPWTTSALNLAWRRVLARARVRYRNPEQLRHTLASTLLSRNAPLLYVQRVGGWRSATVLLSTYARWLPQEGIDGGSLSDVTTTPPTQPTATPAQPREPRPAKKA